MLMWAAGSRHRGFTLLELLIVMAIIAIASAGISFVIRDSSEAGLEQDAQRLAALLESARAQSRLSGRPVIWRPTDEGFVFDGLPPKSMPDRWLGSGISVHGEVIPGNEAQIASAALLLGPEPMIGQQGVTITLIDRPAVQYRIFTDGLRSFNVKSVGNP